MSTSYDIPKKLHLYWGIEDTLSWLNYLTVKSFLNYNPEWDVTIWYDINYNKNKTWATNEQKIIYVGKNYFNDLKSLNNVKIKPISESGIKFHIDSLPEVQKSDIFRYFILFEEGGLYSDFDIFYINSIKHILSDFKNLKQHKLLLTFNPDYLNISFMASNKNNPFFKDLYLQCLLQSDNTDYQTYGTKLILKKFENFSNIKQIYKNMECISISNTTIHPYLWYQLEELFLDNRIEKITNDCIGVHWYNGSDIAKNYLNNPNKYSTISKLIEKIKL